MSCRWAEWLGANDKDSLKAVSGDGAVLVLQLDPLTQRNIRDILTRNHDVDDTDEFISRAKLRGIQGLLTNPQTLALIAESVARGDWPTSRQATFQQACKTLADETNGEHLVRNPRSTNIGNIVEAAGQLCAVQVLAGIVGYTLPDRATPSTDYPSLEGIEGDVAVHSKQALGTRLFTGVSEGRFAPVHRQIAEFLAAQHIARLIDDGLPVQRVVALITGFDGEILPTFFNFSSWLAVHSKPSRPWLSRLTPTGLIYAADKQIYSLDEKQCILKDLKRESAWNPRCLRSHSKVSGIGNIVSLDLEETFHDILSDSDRSHQHQPYMMTLMQMLADGEPLPGLSDRLQDIVSDSLWFPGVRCAALDVLLAYNQSDCLESHVLVNLADGIESGTIEDDQDELLGILLKALYPQIWSVNEIQRFLRMPKMDSRTGEFSEFWTRHVPEQSTPDQIGYLLDLVVTRFDEYRPFMTGNVGRYTRMGVLPLELLDKLRHGYWDSVAVDRLLLWLKVASELRYGAPDSLTNSIAFQLQWNRDKLKELIAFAVDTCLTHYDLRPCRALVRDWLFGSVPFDYGPWSLEKALSATDARVAAFYLGELVECVSEGSYSGGLTIERVRARLAGDVALLKLMDERLHQLEESPPQDAGAHSDEPPVDTAEQIAWQERIKSQAQELQAGDGVPRLLHEIAEVYLGLDENVAGTDPSERLANLVGKRMDLVEILQTGLEKAVDRGDLPSCCRVVRLFDSRSTHFLVFPFIAGLDSLQRSGRLKVEELSENQIRLAVTLLYTIPGEYLSPEPMEGIALYRPEWFRTVLQDCPELVADVLQRCVELKHRTAKQLAVELYYLARDEDHREIARLASLPLLEQFPNTGTDQACWQLRWLLKSALRNCDRSQVHHIIRDRLVRKELAPSQRIYWLLAGYLVSPRLYRKQMSALCTEDDATLLGISTFVSEGLFPKELTKSFEPEESELLVVLIASAIKRHGVTEEGWWIVPDLLYQLVPKPLPEASEALERMACEPSLTDFGPDIAGARDRQARRRREHEFQHFDIHQVTKTLAKEAPANAADLAALLSDVLEDLSKQIRDGSTSDWRQYWNVDRYNRPVKPKPEDACRDALLSDLRSRVERLGVDAQPEGVYADDRRSDIRAYFGGFNVPVEIKRSCHSDLWTAIEDQLIAKYTRDPGAVGYGIFVVFWFGDAEGCSPIKLEGWTPPDAESVQAKLTERMSERDRQVISICVIDVSTTRS